MSMKSASSSRRLYKRSGSFVLTLSGVYFGPKVDADSKIDFEKEVNHKVLKPGGGRKRVEVSQGEGDTMVTEVWTEKHLTFTKRTPKVVQSTPVEEVPQQA